MIHCSELAPACSTLASVGSAVFRMLLSMTRTSRLRHITSRIWRRLAVSERPLQAGRRPGLSATARLGLACCCPGAHRDFPSGRALRTQGSAGAMSAGQDGGDQRAGGRVAVMHPMLDTAIARPKSLQRHPGVRSCHEPEARANRPLCAAACRLSAATSVSMHGACRPLDYGRRSPDALLAAAHSPIPVPVHQAQGHVRGAWPCRCAGFP